MQCIPLFHDLTLYMNSRANQASLTDTISHKLTNCNLSLCPSWVFGNMVRGTNARGRGRGRTSRQTKRPLRYRDAEAEVEVPTQPTARDPSPEPTTPAMEATLGAIMSRLDDMQRQINESKSLVATSPPRARKRQARRSPSPVPGPSHHEVDCVATSPPRARKRSARRSPSPVPGPSHYEVDSAATSPPRARKRSARRSPSPEPSTSHQPLSFEGESDNTQTEYTFIPQTATADFGSLVGEAVSAKVRAKILANQYVDLAELLPQYSRQQAEEYLCRPDANNGTGGYVRKQAIHNLPILQWVEAFDVFTAVYLGRAQSKEELASLTLGLLTYKRNIMNIKKQNYDWHSYDRQFRIEMEHRPISWAATRHDLLLQYRLQNDRSPRGGNHSFRGRNNGPASSGPKQTSQGSLKTTEGHTLPLGHCLAFRSEGKSCTAGADCRFKHKCPNCHKRHPVYRQCNKSSQNPPPTK